MSALEISGDERIGRHRAQLAQALAERNIRTVLLVVRSFVPPFGGGKLLAVSIVRTLRAAGADVTFAALRTDAEFCENFRDLGPIEVLTDDLRPMIGRSFDLVLTHQWDVTGLLLLECGVEFRHLALLSLSSFLPGEGIFGFDEKADALVFESSHNQEAQAASLARCPAPRLVLRNALPAEWFDGRAEPAPDKPRRIAIISNHRTAELIDLHERLERAGVSVSWTGRGGEPQLVDPAFIDRHDAVVSIGGSVQKSMVRGVPVYCYDRFGGPGYITPETYAKAEHFNYSGRCCFRKIEGAVLLEEVLGSYAAVRAKSDELLSIARARYSLDERLAELAGLLPLQTEARSFLGPEHDNLRRLFHFQANAQFSMPVFAPGYMVSRQQKPGLRMVRVHLAAASGSIVDVASRWSVPRYLFLSEIPTAFLFRLRVTLRETLPATAVFVGEEGRKTPVTAVSVTYRENAGQTNMTVSLAYPVNLDTRAFRLFLKRKGEAVIELMRVELSR